MGKRTFLEVSLKAGRQYQLFRVDHKQKTMTKVGRVFHGREEEYLRSIMDEFPPSQSGLGSGKGRFEIQRVRTK